jgi:Bacteriophage HK97-gp10, putative tail-component
MSAQTEKLKARLAAIPKAVKQAVAPAIEAAAEDLARSMRDLAHVRHGALRDSITVTPPGGTTPKGDRVAGETQSFVTADAGHATYVEFGHMADGKHVPAEPFFWPAYRLRKKALQAQIKRAVRAAVKAEWRA